MEINKDNFDLVIDSGKTEKTYWQDIWRYRELFYTLVWRDIKIRYKQAVLGIGWSVIRPVITMAIFVIVFDKLAKMPSEGIPYPILVFSALLPWQFFATSFTDSSNSLIGNALLVSKVYFPRIIMPTSAILTGVVDFLISLVILAIIMIAYKFTPTINLLSIPILVLYAFLLSFSMGLWVSAINVKYRDFKFIVPFMVQAGLYISPVGYTSSVVPEEFKVLYNLNPMVGLIDSFRWAIIGNLPFPTKSVFISFALILVLSFISINYFRKTEKKFADII